MRKKIEKTIQKGVRSIKHITLNATEKESMLHFILSKKEGKKIVLSPYFFAVSYTLVVVLFFSGVATYASGNSLPGDRLYGFKVNVVEPVKGSFKWSSADKARYESGLAVSRITEAEALSLQSKLDPVKELRLSNLFDNHVDSLNESLTSLLADKDNFSPEQYNSIITDFQANVSANAKVLDILTSTSTSSSKIQLSSTVRAGGNKVKVSLKHDYEEQEPTEYTQRKTNVESLINSTSSNLSNLPKELASNPGQSIIDSTSETINQAKQLLLEAGRENKSGNSETAHAKLMESETSIKEAGILLKTGLKIGIENKSRIKR